MSIESTRREFSNVIAGLSVDGRSSDLPPLSFSKSENVLTATVCAADLMLRVLGFAQLSTHARTQLLWKLAAYVSKAGVRPQAPSLATRAVHAAQFLATRPRLITSRMGLGKIIQLSEQQERERLNAQDRTEAEARRTQLNSSEIIPWQMPDGDAPPRPILWISSDKRFRLEELVHPSHLMEEGINMHHCLSWKTQDYWRSIRLGRRRIYSLRQDRDYVATFTHVDQKLTELAVIRSRDDAIIDALADAYRHVDRIYGPLVVNLRDGAHYRLWSVLQDPKRHLN